MAGWLSSAGKAFQRRPLSEPQQFELRCVCGSVVGGERKTSYQRLVCPGCGTPLFVLPASVYPTPKGVKPAKQKQTPPVKIVPQRVIEPDRESRAAQAAESKRPAASRVVEPRLSPAQSLNARQAPRLRKWFTPVRIVFLCVLVVMAGTTWWLLHSRTMQQAQVLFASSSKKGLEALQKGDFVAAAPELRQAAEALDTLGRDDPQARGIRQMGRESNAASHLTLKSLHDILAEAVASETAPSSPGWPEIFRGTYKDAWTVIETTITRTDEPAPAPRYRFEFPIIIGQRGVQNGVQNRAILIADLKAFDALPADLPSHRVIFAAQLQDCRRDPNTANTWQITLNATTAFLWSDAANYSALDLTPDAQSLQTLAAQTTLLGISQ